MIYRSLKVLQRCWLGIMRYMSTPPFPPFPKVVKVKKTPRLKGWQRSGDSFRGRREGALDGGGAQAPAESSGKAQKHGKQAVRMTVYKAAPPPLLLSSKKTLSELSSQV